MSAQYIASEDVQRRGFSIVVDLRVGGMRKAERGRVRSEAKGRVGRGTVGIHGEYHGFDHLV